MTTWTLLRRSLKYYARAHVGVVVGAAIGSAALVGALVVGDSVRESLRRKALEAVGPFHFAISPGDRFFTASLAERVRQNAEGVDDVASILVLPGIVSSREGGGRANNVQVLGIGSEFLKATGVAPIPETEALLNPALARQLGVKPGMDILVRVQKPNALSGDVSLTPREDSTATLRLRVGRILAEEAGGNFSLRRSQLAPPNIFVSQDLLASTAEIQGKANVLLTGGLKGSSDPSKAAAELETSLNKSWRLEDAALELRVATNASVVELRTPRVFLDRPVVRAAEQASSGAFQVLTYLANTIEGRTNLTPYSFVAAAPPPLTPEGLAEDEILLSQWLAEDLGIHPGDTVKLTYFLPESGAHLMEGTNEFRVRTVVPMEMPWDDRTLMPEFPGVEKAESTRDWEFGFELVHEIRQKDEDYWQARRGTPKAFISLTAGQKLWGNRFGEVTALRWKTDRPEETKAELRRSLTQAIEPRQLGFIVEPIRALALQGAAQSHDFGQLFLGFSFFLVLAALLLMALLFQFGLEQRTEEVGTFLALGFRPKKVRRILLGEGTALALFGGLLGLLGGIAYSKGMLRGLTTIWRSATGTNALEFYAAPSTLIIGLTASTVVAVVTLWITLRKQARRPARELLSEGSATASLQGKSRGRWIAIGAFTFAAAIMIWALSTGETANAGAFFGIGALVLLSGLGATSAFLARLARSNENQILTNSGLAVRGAARRRKRSVATAALLACGCFVIMAVGAFRLDAGREHSDQSGTGGFELIGETTLPVYKDLNSDEGRDFYAISEQDMQDVSLVPFRVRAGDDASCLNLNRAQKPRLLGVRPELLKGRFTFASVQDGLAKKADWDLLKNQPGGNEVPAIGDAASIQWALGKKVGDTIDYTDESGQMFKVRIVGAIANSMLQGNLIVDEQQFLTRYPGEGGYRMFLIDAPKPAVELRENLSRALQDVGLELTLTVDRLNAFNAVQNTYLGTFQFLGGLGLLLGSAGLGIVVLRNVLERRGELGLFVAVGFRRGSLLRLILVEHFVLLVWGLGLGILAALIAVLPSVITPGSRLPYGSLVVTLLAVLLNGLLWTWAATRFALRGNLLSALRNE